MPSKGTAKGALAEFRGRVYDSIAETIGATPLVRIHHLAPNNAAKGDILSKCQFFNPLGSVKDRICVSMIASAEGSGRIKPGTVLVEPTSGNTGTALALVCAAKGYRRLSTTPDSMSLERRKILKLRCAELKLTPATQGMRGAIAKAEEIVKALPTLSSPSSSVTRRIARVIATRPQRRSETTPAVPLMSW
jgi:cysteine synthase A